MKRMLLILIAASVVSFIVCTNGTESKQNGTEQHNGKTEHPSKDSVAKKKDSLGMRMASNELDSKRN